MRISTHTHETRARTLTRIQEGRRKVGIKKNIKYKPIQKTKVYRKLLECHAKLTTETPGINARKPFGRQTRKNSNTETEKYPINRTHNFPKNFKKKY